MHPSFFPWIFVVLILAFQASTRFAQTRVIDVAEIADQVVFHKISSTLVNITEARVDEHEDDNVSDGENEDGLDDDPALDQGLADAASTTGEQQEAMDIDADPDNDHSVDDEEDDDAIIFGEDDSLIASDDCSSDIEDVTDPQIVALGYLAIRLHVAAES